MNKKEKEIIIVGQGNTSSIHAQDNTEMLSHDKKELTKSLPDKARWRYSTHLSAQHGNRKQPVAAKRPDGSTVLTSFKNAEKQGWEILRFVTKEEYNQAQLKPQRDAEASYIALLQKAHEVGGTVKTVKTRSGVKYVIEKP